MPCRIAVLAAIAPPPITFGPVCLPLPIMARLKPLVAKDAVLVSDGQRIYSYLADEYGVRHIAFSALNAEHGDAGFHFQSRRFFTFKISPPISAV